MRHEGKTIVVTGAAGAIGFATAEILAREGARVMLVDIAADRLEQCTDQLRNAGHEVIAHHADCADEAQVESAFAEALKAMGRIDGCFANAGVSQARANFHELTTVEWRRVLSVNLDGAFFTMRAAARHMVERSKTGDKAGGGR